MTLDDLKAELDELQKLLNADNMVSERDAEIRGGKFLEAQYKIAGAIRTLDRELFKLESYKSAVWHSALVSAVGTVDIKKAQAEADQTFTTVQEQYSAIESDLNYLRMVARIFSDAHVFYRLKMKEMKNGNL